MFQMSETIGKLSAALAKAQGEMSGAAKDASNPHFKSKYATLEAVRDAIKEPLTKYELSYTQHPGAIVDGSIEMTTLLAHSSGEWMRSTMQIPLGKRDAQGMGSAVSYGRRYSLMAVLGIPAEDDDGNAASEAPKAQQKPVKPALVQSGPVKTLEPTSADADHAIKLIENTKNAQALADIWKASWVQDIAKSGTADADRVVAAKETRKAELNALVLQAG